MAYELKKPKQEWRDYLLTEEALEIRAIEAASRRTPKMQLTFERIRTRACQRLSRAKKGTK